MAQYGVRANTVDPTVVEIGMGKRHPWTNTRHKKDVLDRHPTERFADVHEIIEPILFLLSQRSSFINGTNIPVDGGFSATIYKSKTEEKE